MGMSTHIIGFKPPDKKWKDMKVVWDACEKADTGVPTEVLEYFNGEEPDERGVEVELETHEWSDDMAQGFEVEISKIPKDVKIIRFYNSW